MNYYIKVTANNGSGKEIEIDARPEKVSNASNIIEGVKIWIDTTNENVCERSSDILNKVEIRIKINSDTNEACRDFMDWSLERSGGDIYRKVHIDVYANSTNDNINNIKGLIRSFDLKEMFVEDYIEEYDKCGGNSNEAMGTATLKLIQAANKSNEFKHDTNMI